VSEVTARTRSVPYTSAPLSLDESARMAREIAAPGAARFGQGESAQFYLLTMALEALSQIAEWTPEYIHRQLRAWTEELVARAEPWGFTAPGRSQRAGYMVGLSSERGLRPDLARAFAERGVYVGIRGSCIRVAPHLHSPLDAMDRFIEALQTLAV
jgi:hypothetical protein